MHKRMDKAGQHNVAAKTPSAYAREMHYDSIVHAPKALRFLIDIAGIDNVHLGTDYSFPPADMEPLASASRRPDCPGPTARRSRTATREDCSPG